MSTVAEAPKYDSIFADGVNSVPDFLQLPGVYPDGKDVDFFHPGSPPPKEERGAERGKKTCHNCVARRQRCVEYPLKTQRSRSVTRNTDRAPARIRKSGEFL